MKYYDTPKLKDIMPVISCHDDVELIVYNNYRMSSRVVNSAKIATYENLLFAKVLFISVNAKSQISIAVEH